MVQVQNFITFELKVFRHEERGTQSFYADCFYIVSSQPNQRAVLVAHKVVWPRRAPKVNLLLRQELNSAFSQIPKSSAHASGAWRHPNTLVQISIWDFYFNISEWQILSACAWTPALMLHLTKPKGKIYKTKSLGNYITNPLFGGKLKHIKNADSKNYSSQSKRNN